MEQLCPKHLSYKCGVMVGCNYGIASQQVLPSDIKKAEEWRKWSGFILPIPDTLTSTTTD